MSTRRRIAGLVKILQDPNEFVLEDCAVVSRIGCDRIFLDHARERTPRGSEWDPLPNARSRESDSVPSRAIGSRHGRTP